MRNKLVNMQAITRVPVALILKHAEVPQERVGFVVGGRIARDDVRHRQHVKAVALFRLTVAPKILEPDTTEDNEGCNRAESARAKSVDQSVQAAPTYSKSLWQISLYAARWLSISMCPSEGRFVISSPLQVGFQMKSTCMAPSSFTTVTPQSPHGLRTSAAGGSKFSFSLVTTISHTPLASSAS